MMFMRPPQHGRVGRLVVCRGTIGLLLVVHGLHRCPRKSADAPRDGGLDLGATG